MSPQGPILVVSNAQRPSFAGALDGAKLFPVIVSPWADASQAVAQLGPTAVLAAPDADGAALDALATQIATPPRRCRTTPFPARKSQAIPIA